MNCDVEGSSGSMTWGCTPATPGTEEIFLIVAAGRRPPAVKPAPIPIPRPATEIWPRTKRSPPSMKRTMRSLMAPSATSPATPIAMPTTVKRYPRSTRSDLIARVATLPEDRHACAPRSRRRPDRVHDGREARPLGLEPLLRAKPADEGRHEVRHPSGRERLQHQQPE